MAEPQTSTTTANIIVIGVTAIALIGYGGMIYSVHSGVTGSDLAVIVSPLATALGILGALATTRTVAKPDPGVLEAVQAMLDQQAHPAGGQNPPGSAPDSPVAGLGPSPAPVGTPGAATGVRAGYLSVDANTTSAGYIDAPVWTSSTTAKTAAPPPDAPEIPAGLK